VRRVGNAPTPRTLKNLGIVIGHDHLRPKVGVDHLIVYMEGVVNHTVHVKGRVARVRNVHGRPN